MAGRLGCAAELDEARWGSGAAAGRTEGPLLSLGSLQTWAWLRGGSSRAALADCRGSRLPFTCGKNTLAVVAHPLRSIVGFTDCSSQTLSINFISS